MAKTTPRLFVNSALSASAEITLAEEQAHYLVNVLRMSVGDHVHAFNGRDGEWSTRLTDVGKKRARITCENLRAAAKPPPDIDYLFAPIKHARLDYMVQKATELGARRLRPVITARTIAERVNLDRMRANTIEAAEQCNLVYVPEVLEPVSLNRTITDWKNRSLIFCDESSGAANPIEALRSVTLPTAILIGPEGGFTEEERKMLRAQPYTTTMNLGPRIMRADTAAIAALSLVQAVVGDWG